MDEDQVTQTPAENVDVAEDSNVDTSPVDETTTSEETEEAPEASAETEPERKPSRAERRIRDLADENRRLRELSYQQNPVFDPSLQMPQYQPGEEIAPERLQADVVQTAQAIAAAQVQSQIQQYEAKSNLERDIEVLEAKYPELSTESGDENLIQKIEARFKREAVRNGQLDPSVRLADIAAEEVEFARAYAMKAQAATNRSLHTLKDETAIRPGGQAKEEKSAKDMSLSELEAKLGVVKG